MVSGRFQKVSRTVSDDARKVSDGVGSAKNIFGKTPGAPRVYFKRLLTGPEYILNDSWQEAYVENMETTDLHVAIVFGPICDPNPDIQCLVV